MIRTKLITSLGESEFKSFLEASINCFTKELLKFSYDNDDPTLLGYCTERSLISFYISSLCRHFSEVTAIQEYKTTVEDKKNGRPDAFIKYNDIAILVESKFQDLKEINQDFHWDIKSWIDWDTKEVYNQVYKYYDSEKDSLQNKIVYTDVYLITMVFKYINDNCENHAVQAIKELNAENKNERDWYYLYTYLPGIELETKEKSITHIGIEVYGTVNKVK